MTWRDLLFAHWPVPAEIVRPLIPPSLELDLFDGHAWVGAVPFLMENTSPRFVPPIPGLHAFPELNLRTYVTSPDEGEDKPGVWFFSLDAGQRLAVRTARAFFHLPYFDARFEIRDGPEIVYRAQRTHRGAPAASFDASYRPVGPTYRSTPGSFDSWLTDRYCLYSADGAGVVYRGDIDHEPWPLQPAEAEIRVNTLGEWLGIRMEGEPAALHFARRLDVHAWLIEPAGA
jgi:uncharacterized protein YqjF (DUF2071 family)